MSQRIVIEILRLNGGVKKAFDRLAREELRREIKAPVGESQAVEDEGHYGTAGADDTRIVNGQQLVDAISDPEVLADSGDESVVVEGKGFQIGIGDFEHWETCLGEAAIPKGCRGELDKFRRRMRSGNGIRMCSRIQVCTDLSG